MGGISNFEKVFQKISDPDLSTNFIGVFPSNYITVYRNTWLGNLKLSIIDLIVSINLDNLKKTVHNLFTTNIQGSVV